MFYVEHRSLAILMQSTGDKKMSTKFCTENILHPHYHTEHTEQRRNSGWEGQCQTEIKYKNLLSSPKWGVKILSSQGIKTFKSMCT